MIKKKRQLIFLWTYLQWGGAQIYFLAIIKRAMAEWDVVVILPHGSSEDLIGFLDDLGVRYEFIDVKLDTQPANTLKRKAERQIRRIRAEIGTLRYLKRFNLKASILHIEIAPWQSWQLLALFSLKGANVFFTLHNFLSGGSSLRRAIWKARTLFVSALPRVHAFAANKDAKNRFRGWFTRKFHQSIEVVYASVDPVQIAEASTADRDSIRVKFGIAPDEFVVLCVGQFIDRKGRWVFLDAAAKLQAKGEEIKYVWLMPQIPNDSEMAEIERRSLKESFKPILSSDVGATRLDILSFFKIADVFAIASYIEGLPIALLEAMALGVPSISTSIFAIPEAVIHEKTGLLIEPGDSNDLAESILRLKNDPELHASLAKTGREFVLANFDERMVAETAIRSYKNCFPND